MSFLLLMLGLEAVLGWIIGYLWLTREPRPGPVPLARLADPAPLPGERFPDDATLILWSEQQAALDVHQREVRYLIEQAERRIGRVQR